MKAIKRSCSVLLVLCLILALLPTAVLAAETELTQLATPTALTWGMDEYGNEIPGVVSWSVEGDCQNQFDVIFYKEGETEPVGLWGGVWGAGEKSSFSDEGFICSDNGSGIYYFTVQSRGDGTAYSDSEIATSETWEYTVPDAQLASIPSIAWDWPYVTWELPAEQSNVLDYELKFFFSAEENGTPEEIGEAWPGSASVSKAPIPDGYVERNGYYYFQIRALSNDITAYQNGPWSELSPAYSVTDISETVADALRDILENERSDVQGAVQELDRNNLRTAMLADEEVLNLITRLEDETSVTVHVEVNTDVAEVLPAKDVQITGAALNGISGNDITLQVGPPEDTTLVIPELYNDALAVRFSMDLEGVEDTSSLAVPVRITLPVPETINPGFLAILHYSANGEAEVLDKRIYQEDGKWYVSFVLDHFSDFVMTEQKTSDVTLDLSNWQPVVGDRMSVTANTLADVGELTYAWYRGTVSEDGSVNFSLIAGANAAAYVVTENDIGYYLECQVSVENYDTVWSVKTWEPVAESEKPGRDDHQDDFIWVIGGISSVSSPTKPTTPMTFTDVSTGDWFYDDVAYVYDNGLMNGTSDTKFSPYSTLTRAMVVTILYRMEGEPSNRFIGRFADVPNYEWYTSAVEWAAKNDIVTGYTATKFGPDDPVTREQLAAILYRYAQYKGRSVAPSDSLSNCTDSAEVASYAVPAVQWAVAGDMLLVNSGKLRPAESANRAEVAAAIASFYSTYLG